MTIELPLIYNPLTGNWAAIGCDNAEYGLSREMCEVYHKYLEDSIPVQLCHKTIKIEIGAQEAELN